MSQICNIYPNQILRAHNATWQFFGCSAKLVCVCKTCDNKTKHENYKMLIIYLFTHSELVIVPQQRYGAGAASMR